MYTRKYSEQEKKQYVKEFKESNQSPYQFARSKGILVSEFKSWLREEQQKANVNKELAEFQESFGVINLNMIEPKKSGIANKGFKFESEYIKIELKENYDKELLIKLMEVLV